MIELYYFSMYKILLTGVKNLSILFLSFRIIRDGKQVGRIFEGIPKIYMQIVMQQTVSYMLRKYCQVILESIEIRWERNSWSLCKRRERTVDFIEADMFD